MIFLPSTLAILPFLGNETALPLGGLWAVGLSAELDVIKDFNLSGVDFVAPRRGVNFIG
jgi:hypothetical protein